MHKDVQDRFANAEIQRVTGSRHTKTVTFGTNKVKRDQWDGDYPVEVWRVYQLGGGHTEEEHKLNCRKSTTLKRGVRKAGSGWRAGTIGSHVELRNGKRS